MGRILIVVDYQNDFVNGSLGFEKAAKLEEAIVRKMEAYRRSGDEIAFTFDTHGADYLQTQEGKKLPVPHCIKNTPGWNLYGRAADFCGEGTKRFEKGAFGSMELAGYLAQNQYDTVELVGVVSNICVISNAVLAKAALPEAEIIVDAACTAGNDDVLNEKALDIMRGMQITVTNRI
jgi:Amidases related to nicotinamidase